MYQAVGESDPMLGAAHNSPVADPEKPGSTAGSGSIRTMRLEAPTRRCNDVLFAILFIANVLTVAVFAFWKGIPAVVKHAKAMMDDDGNDIAGPEEDGDYTKVFALSAALVAISIAVSAFWMRFLMAYATSLIRLALWLNVVVIVVFAIISFSVQPIMSGIMLVGAGLNVWFIFAVRSRIAFAAANLKSACAAVGEHMGVFWVALFMIIKQFLWLMLWSLCAIGVYQHFKDVDPECDKAEAAHAPNAPSHFCGGTSAGLAMFFLLLSVYWGQQVIQNVLTCTTAGVVATWWYQPESDKVTFSAFYRSLTTSFGSICFGSLIVAVLHALRSMAALAKEKAAEDNNVALACVACLAECVLGCIERIMEYINQWAYVYVGIYGYDFRTSGKAVTDLFVNRGFTAVINDDLTQTALTIGAFGVGFVGLVVGLLMVQFSPVSWFAALGDKQSAFGVLGAIGFISGLGMAMVLANVIITALHTVFVCFAEDPIALSRNHPHEYEILVGGWREFHGEALHHAYGSAV